MPITFFAFAAREPSCGLVTDLPSSNCHWKQKFFFCLEEWLGKASLGGCEQGLRLSLGSALERQNQKSKP